MPAAARWRGGGPGTAYVDDQACDSLASFLRRCRAVRRVAQNPRSTCIECGRTFEHGHRHRPWFGSGLRIQPRVDAEMYLHVYKPSFSRRPASSTMRHDDSGRPRCTLLRGARSPATLRGRNGTYERLCLLPPHDRAHHLLLYKEPPAVNPAPRRTANRVPSAFQLDPAPRSSRSPARRLTAQRDHGRPLPDHLIRNAPDGKPAPFALPSSWPAPWRAAGHRRQGARA